MCINDELGRHIVGDARTHTLWEIWNQEPLRRVREIHRAREGYRRLGPCKACNMPRKTEMVPYEIGGKVWTVERIVGRPQEIGR